MAVTMVEERLGVAEVQWAEAAPLVLEKSSNGRKPITWVTSDHHFGHANIILHANRPYEDVGEMDEALIGRWNSVVGESDIVYHLGDFCLGSAIQAGDYLRKLNGNVIMLSYPWHHDKWLKRKVSPVEGIYVLETLARIKFDGPMAVFKYRDMPVHMCHYPLWSWDKKHYGAVHIHGHIHGSDWRSPVGGLSVDAGVDANYFFPMSMEFIYNQWSERVDLGNGEWAWSEI